jgi:preprotein translocase SecE subunit
VARNRKRAKERAARSGRPGVATARAHVDEAPDPIEHAAPDVELAEAQLAVGRPELPEEPDDEVDADAELDAQALAPVEAGDGGERDRGRVAEEGPEPSAPLPATRVSTGSRLVGFLQGSWRELQRVQWPDRRQVMQATGVVIGFVIVAGAYLGVADALAGKIMDAILK